MKSWLFCDEKLFTIQSTGAIAWTKPCSPRPARYIGNIKSHVQAWGVVWWDGKIFSRYDGYMNSLLYQQLLDKHLTPHMSNLHHRLFYQDNIPLHRAPIVLTWFQNKGLKLIDVPAYCPEFNAIEYVWSWLKNYVQTQQPKSKTELELAIDSGCNAFSQKVIQQYIVHISTMMQRTASV